MIRTTTSTKPNLEFTYDASGNRIAKKVIQPNGNYSTTFYVRDASGNVMAVYKISGTTNLSLEEQHIYGSSRLGIFKKNKTRKATTRALGERRYELTDHLGNVRVVLSDYKKAESIVISATDYYPFGMVARTYTSPEEYRYGFNGKELDRDEEGMGGGGSTYDYGFRIYNPALARFLSVDPLTRNFSMLTPYQYASNKPITSIDIDGLEALWFLAGPIEKLIFGTNHIEKFVSDVVVGAAKRVHEIVVGTFDAVLVANAVNKEIFGDVPITSISGDLSDTEIQLELIKILTSKAFKEAVHDYSDLIKRALEGDGEAIGALAIEVLTFAVEGDEFRHLSKVAKLKGYTKGGGVVIEATKIKKVARNSKSATSRRVKLRKSTVEAITDNQPKNMEGQIIDPYDLLPLKDGEFDIGHKPGQEWWRRKEMHNKKGSTRQQVIEEENNPNLYQLERRSNNRSRKYEKKK